MNGSHRPHPWIERCLALAVLCGAGCASGQPYHVYWGDVHGHTANSDGKGTVEQYFAHARDVADLDFAIVSDHDFGNGAPWRMPREVWSATQAAAEACTADGEFIAIAGYEWTSEAKYWPSPDGETPSENHFEGQPRHYNHKNVYFPGPVPYLLSSKEEAYKTPDRLAGAVRQAGGLVHNNHPAAGLDGRDQWDYDATSAEVIANTEIGPDRMRYGGKDYDLQTETIVREFLNRGGRTGFVKGTDTHDGRPAARTAVLAAELTREGIFEALRNRRCYAVTHARILLDVRIDEAWMGEEIEVEGAPTLSVDVSGTDRIEEVAVIRDGSILVLRHPGRRRVRFQFTDLSFAGDSYYYVRVTQADRDPQGNPSRAWSSPIWVRRGPSR